MKNQEQLEITVKDLLEAGAHFGHQKHRWNPKMKRYIFEERNGIYIIDLAKTMQQLRDAKKVIEDVVTNKKSILFVGTKKQAKSIIEEIANETKEYFVNHRWLGGMLTNLPVIKKSIKTLEKIEKKIAAGSEGLTKKEFSNLNHDMEKLRKNLSGIRAMRKQPGLMIVVDPSEEHIAVKEAKKLNIPVLALVDTNCNPDNIDHVVACNDDAVKSIRLILKFFASAIIEKKKEMKIYSSEKEPALEQEKKK